MSLTVGKTEESWRKHDILESVASAFIATANAKRFDFFRRNPSGIGIDMHAGDAKGVPHKQGDFFRVNESTTTPAIFERLSRKYDFPVLLCERDKAHRASLSERFANFAVTGDHANAPNFIAGLNPRPTWGLCISDPNGHGKLGAEHMAKLGRLMKRMDFAIVFPQGAVTRHLAVGKEGDDAHHANGAAIAGVRATVEKYEWMMSDEKDRWGDHLPSREWMSRIGRSHMAATRLISASRNFRYRVIVVSNYLPQGITRNQLFQVMK